MIEQELQVPLTKAMLAHYSSKCPRGERTPDRRDHIGRKSVFSRF